MARPEAVAGVEDSDLAGTTALVTGATDGIGRETALALGRLGARVLVHGRDREKGRAAIGELESLGADAEAHYADFADLAAVRELADWTAKREPDLLVNNAGAYFDAGTLTDAGFERTFHVDQVAPFLLTRALLPALGPDGGVVTVASEAHRGVELDFDRARSVEGYDGLWAYRHAKLANVLFTRELARRARVATDCCHPGFVPGSALWRSASRPVRAGVGLLRRLPDPLSGLIATTPAEAAATPVFLAANEGDGNGGYYADCAPATPAAPARDDEAARRLWEALDDAA
jgi:NAD(P)-dependent dehydrogenase (short-subunit alcohol dehydrogenase family)